MTSTTQTDTTRTSTYTVEGMTCGHCVGAVTQEISALPGVEGVDVDLATGRVIVSSVREMSHEAIAAAVDEAGYRLAS